MIRKPISSATAAVLSDEAAVQRQRRVLIRGAGAATLACFGPWTVNRAWAQAGTKKPLVIGLSTDDTGQYAASGQDERRGMLMAIAEVNAKGGVLGRKLETIHTDTGGDPVKAAAVAQRMLSDNAGFLLGGVHSGAANAISQVAQKAGCIYFNTNSSSPTEAGKDCHRTKFVWDGNGTNFSTSVVKGAMTGFGREWVLLTHDYTWGHNTAKGIRSIVESFGGKIVAELMVPQNSKDFSKQLQKIQELRPGVIATAVGGDDLKILRAQVREAGMDRSFGWINNQADWPDVYGLGREAMFGIFGTTWYWNLSLPNVKAFVERYQAFNKDYRLKTPGNVFYNGYMATHELFKAIERVDSTNNLKIIRELENLRVPAAQRMQHEDAYMNPTTHQLQQNIYMAAYNSFPKDPDDIFRILGRLRPDQVEDKASVQTCKLESYASTPTFEP